MQDIQLCSSPSLPEQWLALGHVLADAAAAAIRPWFRAALAIDTKADQTPVTVTDRAAEAAMRRLIHDRFPDHGILGEEYGSERPDSERVWVLDPIDGTSAFIAGIPTFGTLIALAERNEPVLGLIAQPISGERWVGRRGAPTLLNGAPIHARPRGGLDRAVLAITTPAMLRRPEEQAAFARLQANVAMTRYGGDCYAYGLLAAGFIDLVLEADLKPYDFMALVPIVTGAGGIISDWEGRPLTLTSGPQVLAAASPDLHREGLRVLSER